MKVEIVTIGDELLLGFTLDSNAAHLARELAAVGVEVARHTTCGDTPADIESAVREALHRTGAVITTGGLGPTADDRTRETIARLFGRSLELDVGMLTELRERWRARGLSGELPDSNRTQALIPDGAHVLRNQHGTAPGLILEDELGRWVAMLPGVPREMRGMLHDSLLPFIAERASGDSVVASHTVRTTGYPESLLADRLGDLAGGFDGLELAFLPGVDGVDLRLTSRRLGRAAAAHALGRGAARLRERVHAYAEGDVDLAGMVLAECRRAMLRIAVAESCTGGMLGARITAVPGASDVFHGGVIAYDNRVKRQLLGVTDDCLREHGAVSEPVALQMARGIRLRLGTEIGLSITGVAGPGGGDSVKPVGTVWVALDIAEGRPPIGRPEGSASLTPERRARVFHLGGDRQEIRTRATQAALDMVRRTIQELKL